MLVPRVGVNFVIASAARQSHSLSIFELGDYFVTSLLAMTLVLRRFSFKSLPFFSGFGNWIVIIAGWVGVGYVIEDMR